MNPIVQRFPWFDTVEKVGTPRETIWKHKRAIEDHKFILVDWEAHIESATSHSNPIHAQIYDGSVYSHWGSFPGIFDQSTLRLAVLQPYGVNAYATLNGWECKEFTMSFRNTDTVESVRGCQIVYFYEIPMTKAEKFEYAVKQPRYKYRHGGARTLDRFED